MSVVSAEDTSDEKDEKKEGNASDSESESVSKSEASDEKTANMDLLDDISDLIEEGKYEKAIDTLNENNDVFEDSETDTARSLMSKAVKGQIEAATSEADSYASQNKYAEALSSIEDMKNYITSLEDKPLSSEYADTQSLDNKYNVVLGKYKSYLSSTGLKYANSGNDNSVNSMFATADNYFEGDEYEQIKNNVYTYLVIANANNYIADGSALSQGITYIRNNVEKTGYNCWVIEYLDVMREQYRVQNNQRNMTVILQNVINGYILPNSSTSYLTENDISYLSQYELYMAYFEIYARHGRTFSDTVVNDYFNGLSWYKGTIAPASFNETQLNEYEKSNAILIYEYQVRMGYR
jgi:hypothetical protein